MKLHYVLFVSLITFFVFAQGRPEAAKVKVSGKVIDQKTNQPLEYATVTLLNPKRPSDIAGGITDAKGEFSFDVRAGVYDIKIEFISYKAQEIKQKEIKENTFLGTMKLAEDATLLTEVQVRTEKTTVEIKLDKKVYNVGKDLLVKGGTVSDVLDNIPSVTVDADGTVALRGNENVRILIDGRPTNAINIAEALRQIPADAIDKVEVVTNPSARYDAEGGGGLLNIVLKKGKNQGTNGTIIASTGDPRNYGLSGNVNFKTEQFNLFTNSGYNYRTNPGNGLIDAKYKNATGAVTNYIDERRVNNRIRDGYNISYGMDWYVAPNSTWTNTFNYRKNSGTNPETVTYNNFDANRVFQNTTFRQNDQASNSFNVEYASNFIKKFKRDGHKFSVDLSFTLDVDNDKTDIFDVVNERTESKQTQRRSLYQTDYVLPFGKASQFEAGYRGDFNELLTPFSVGSISANNVFTPYLNFTNTLEYKESVNALYTQIGSKFNKFSFLFGLRWEDSVIEINQLTTGSFNTKKYNNFFPSAFFAYEFSESTSFSLSYSKRVSRPRGRLINPFSGYASNINIFQGNPDLDPAFTNAIDFGFLKKWEKVTLSTSAYVNQTEDSFQFVRKESGTFALIAGVLTPVIITTPINLATERRFGFEFTINYSPYKWWKLNSNFNFFKVSTRGNFVYTDFNNLTVTQNFDNDASAWFTRLTSKITLPLKIDWQTNITYNGPQNNAQGRVFGVYAANIGFSKDIFKEKATIAVNVQDVFNSRKRIFSTELPRVDSYTEFQRAVRQINFSVTYRFNKKKGEKERPVRQSDGGEDFQG
jgi:outer membrane receptor for ferrienterochelin and colicins